MPFERLFGMNAMGKLIVGFSVVVAAQVLSGGAALAKSPVMKAGSLTGPVAVTGGKNLTEVAHLNLTSGNWTVFAKGLLQNTTQELFTAHPVRCTLVIGSESDAILASPVGAGADSSREVFLLTLSAHLSAPGPASLRCTAPGSSTGDIEVRWIRMVAIQTGGLSTAALGDSYQQLGNPSAASQVYEVHSTTAIDLPHGVEGDVATMDLPAGSWSITAKATVAQASATSNASFTCGLEAFDNDHIAGTVNDKGQIADRLPIALEIVHQFVSPGTVHLTCQSGAAAGSTQIRDIRLTAYRASGLLNQYLEFDNMFAPLSGKPIVNAGFDDAPPTLSGGPGYEYITSMTLPAGSWAVVAKAYLESSVAFAFERVRCKLGDGTSTDDVELYIPSPQTIDNVQPATLIWSGGGAAGPVVTLSCHVATPGVNVKWVKMTAYKAGRLKSSALQ